MGGSGVWRLHGTFPCSVPPNASGIRVAPTESAKAPVGFAATLSVVVDDCTPSGMVVIRFLRSQPQVEQLRV